MKDRRFADVYSSGWLAYLRSRFETELLGRDDMDAGTEFDLSLLMRKDRSLTQRIATLAHQSGYDGIYYISRYGADLSNWAIFEEFDLQDRQVLLIDADYADLTEARKRLELDLDLDR